MVDGPRSADEAELPVLPPALQQLRVERNEVGPAVVVTAPRPQITDLDALPFPDRDLLDHHRYGQYLSDGRAENAISIMATRGCPFKCLYCHKIWPKTQMVRSADNVFQEVLFHYRRGCRAFTFLDDIFNLNRRNSAAFFRLVIKNKLKIRIFFSNGLRGDILTPDYIDLMSEAGVVQLVLALETASPRLQRLLEKNVNLEKLRANLDYLCERHPHIVLDLFTMFGFPTETEEEALMTLEYIKGIRWLHFPHLFALKIFPGTNMAAFAMRHGVTRETIERSASLGFREVDGTIPFSDAFGREYRIRFLTEYFLLPERLEHVIRVQKNALSRDEVIARYQNYFPGGVENCPEIAHLIGDSGFYSEDVTEAQGDRMRTPPGTPSAEEAGQTRCAPRCGLRILLIDLSRYFSSEPFQLNTVMESPLGLLYLLTCLNRQYGSRINGKIAKSMVDFDSFEELRGLINDFRPQLIGIRTLSLYKEFFHKTVALIKRWCPDVPIVHGGPYATSEYATCLADRKVDVVVLGEGEMTFGELIGKILENGDKLPDDDVLEAIAGIAFMPRRCGADGGAAG